MSISSLLFLFFYLTASFPERGEPVCGLSSSESAKTRAKVLPVHVGARCSDPGWDLARTPLTRSFLGGTARAGGSGTVPLRRGVCFAGGLSPPDLLVLQLPPDPLWSEFSVVLLLGCMDSILPGEAVAMLVLIPPLIPLT